VFGVPQGSATFVINDPKAVKFSAIGRLLRLREGDGNITPLFSLSFLRLFPIVFFT